MTTFLTLGLLSGKCSLKSSKVTSDPDPNQNDMDPKHWFYMGFVYESCSISSAINKNN